IISDKIEPICNAEHDRADVHDLPRSDQAELVAGQYPAKERSHDEDSGHQTGCALGYAEFIIGIAAARYHQQEHRQHTEEFKYEYNDEIFCTKPFIYHSTIP